MLSELLTNILLCFLTDAALDRLFAELVSYKNAAPNFTPDQR